MMAGLGMAWSKLRFCWLGWNHTAVVQGCTQEGGWG